MTVLYFLSFSYVSVKYTNLLMLNLRNSFFQFVQDNLLGSEANPFACKAGDLCFSPFYYLILSVLVSGKFCQGCI